MSDQGQPEVGQSDDPPSGPEHDGPPPAPPVSFSYPPAPGQVGPPPAPGQVPSPHPGGAPYPAPQYAGAPQPYPYPYPYPYAYPPQSGYRAPRPPLQHVTATRFFAAGTLTGFVLIIIFGFLTFSYVTPKASGDNSMISGWGEWTHQGEDLPLHHGASAMIIPGVLAPLLILLPTVLMAIIILCNIARRGLSIASTLFAVLASLLALGLTMAPDDVVIVFDSSSNDYIDKHYDFSAGPSAWLTAAMCVLITVCCIGGIVFGSKAKA